MSTKKLLWQELDQTKQMISDQMSHQKTTLKEFSSYFKDLSNILKSIIEQILKLSRKSCEIEFENKSIKGIIDNGITQILRMSDIIGSFIEKCNNYEQDLFNLYLQIKQSKDQIMDKCDKIKKERDFISNNKNQDPKYIEQFSQQVITNMQENILIAQQTEKQKNTILINSFTRFLNEKIEILDLSKTSVIVYQEYFTNLQQEYPILSKQKTQLQVSNSQSINSSSSTQQSQKIDNKEQKQIEPNYVIQHKEKLQLLRKKFNQNVIITQLPIIIKDQVGIFNQQIPNNLDIAKEFLQTDFYYCLILMMIRYNSQLEEWPTFIQHTKNKFKISLSQLKQIQQYSIFIQSDETKIIVSPFVRMIKDVIEIIKSEKLKEEQFYLEISKKIILFSLINGYWSQKLLVEEFKLQNQNSQHYHNYFNQSIKYILFEEKQLNQITYLQSIDDISYPLNQCFLELLLSVTIETQTIDIDYIQLIYKFAQDVLRLSPAHVGVTLLSQVYTKILQPSLRVKNLEIKDAILSIQQLTESLRNVIQAEKTINQSQMEKIMKLKNCDKLYRELTGLIRNFWSQLPSDKQFLYAFMDLYFLVNSIQLEQTEFHTIYELYDFIFQTIGHEFYGMIIKREQIQLNQINDQTINQISSLIQIICKESLELKQTYLDEFANGIYIQFQNTKEQVSSLFFKNFIQGVISEIEIYMEQIEICQVKKLIKEDLNGSTFALCYQIAQLEDKMLPYEIIPILLQKCGATLELWFQQSQINTFQILQQLIQKEKFIDEEYSFKEQLASTQTKSIEDYCSLLFKSVESLQQIYRLNDQNSFKKLVYQKMESVLYQATLLYLESLEQNVKQWSNNQYLWFPQISKMKNNYSIDQKKIVQQQVHQTLGLMMRICNINFLQQQFEHLKEQLKFNVVDILNSDFISKGKLICKYVAQIIVHEIFSPNLFNQMHQDIKNLNDPKQYQINSEWSMKAQVEEVKDFFLICNSKLPSNYCAIFYDFFIESFFQKFFFQLFDLNKLTNIQQQKYQELLILEMQELQQFLIKHISSNVIHLRIKQKISEMKDCAMWFGLSNQDLIKVFEQQNLLNTNQINKINAAALYRILLLRKSDSKIKDVVKKYQKLYE